MPEAPVAASFERGVAYLERVAREWGESRDCVSCHTNGWALAAQPVIAGDSDELESGRVFAREYLTRFLDGDEQPHGQHGSVEGMVATAAFLRSLLGSGRVWLPRGGPRRCRWSSTLLACARGCSTLSPRGRTWSR